jgi:hypothetical protein
MSEVHWGYMVTSTGFAVSITVTERTMMLQSLHVYHNLYDFFSLLKAYGIDAADVKVRECTSNRTMEVIPNVFLIWR